MKKEDSLLRAAFNRKNDLSAGKRVLYGLLGVTIEPIIKLGEGLNKIGVKTDGELNDWDFKNP
ncbi:MAG: hypothetical protein J6039_06035 [Alphaproteobacteria bacterium]|nr:hypothetical protein [Alphaproteobacteria bacterium]